MSPLDGHRQAGNHRVAIVLDPHFAGKLIPLAARMHVWACDSPENRETAERIWAEARNATPSNERGVTTFVPSGGTHEEVLCEILPTVDEHHGRFSHDPPWSRIEVHGARLTPEVRAALEGYGATSYREFDGGFVAERPQPERTC
jgi:hypothetical protein